MRIKTIVYGLLMASVVGLTACDEEYYGDGHHHDDVDQPSLYSANMIDTYNTNSEFEDEHLALSPLVNAGEFEVFWDMHSRGDFFVELRVNTQDTTDGSLLVTSDWCSAYSDCYNYQSQFCDYSYDLYVECETPSGSYQAEYIGDLIGSLPQELFFIVQVCDTSFIYCEYLTLPVIME